MVLKSTAEYTHQPRGGVKAPFLSLNAKAYITIIPTKSTTLSSATFLVGSLESLEVGNALVGVSLLSGNVLQAEGLGVGVLERDSRGEGRGRASGSGSGSGGGVAVSVVVSGGLADGADVRSVVGKRVDGGSGGGEGGRRAGGDVVAGERRRSGSDTGVEDTAGGRQDVRGLTGRAGDLPSERGGEGLVDEPVLPEVDTDLRLAGQVAGKGRVSDDGEDVGELELLDGDVLREPTGPGGLEGVLGALQAELVGLGEVNVGGAGDGSQGGALEDGGVQVGIVSVVGERRNVGRLVVLAGEGVVVLESVGLGQEGQVVEGVTTVVAVDVLADNEDIDESGSDSALSDTETITDSSNQVGPLQVAAVAGQETVVGEGVQGRARTARISSTGSSVVLGLNAEVLAAVGIS